MRLGRIASFSEAQAHLIIWQTEVSCRHSQPAFTFNVKIDGTGYVTLESLVCSDVFQVLCLLSAIVDKPEVLRLRDRPHHAPQFRDAPLIPNAHLNLFKGTLRPGTSREAARDGNDQGKHTK